MAWRARTMTAAAGAAALGASLMAGSAMAATPIIPPAEMDESLTPVTILNINDFHGRIDSGSLNGALGNQFACAATHEKASAGAGNYLFLSAGDNIGATPFVSSSQQDNPTIDFLSTLGLQASAVGNHEFDYGFADLRDRVVPRAKFPYLGANVYNRGTSTPALPEFEVLTVNDVTIGVIGAVTSDTPSLVSSSGVQSIDFGDPVAAVNRVATKLSDGNAANGEADIIIAQYHEGAFAGQAENSSLEAEVARGGVFGRIVTETSPLVDAIFTGHTHKLYAWDGPTADGKRPVIQSNSYGTHIGVVELGIDATKKSIEYTRVNESTSVPAGDAAAAWWAACEADATFRAARDIVTAAVAQAKVVGSKVVGKVTADITTAFEGQTRDQRTRESTLGNLTANIWLDSMNQPGRPTADIGIMNPGGLRAELLYAPDGVITLAEASSVHPFANTMQTIDITGAQFKTLLEQQWPAPDATRSFLKLGLSDNVRYTFDPDAKYGEHITGVWFEGKPMNPTATYTIASGSFLISGGDGFVALRGGTNLVDSGLIDTDAFVNYFLANSPVSPSFEKNGVAVKATLPVVVSAGGSTTFEVSGVDLTSLGAPDNKTFTVHLGDRQVGTATIETVRIDGVPTRDGRAVVTLTVPKDFPAGDTVITLVAKESGTTVKLLAQVKAAVTGPVVETDVPAGNGAGSLGLLAGLLVAAAAGGLVVAGRRKVTDS